MTISEQLWVGLAEVSPHRGTNARAGMAGAYVQVATCAVSVDTFIARAAAALFEEGFEVLVWEDVLPVGPGWPSSDADPSLVAAGSWAIEHNDVGLADLHWFPEQSNDRLDEKPLAWVRVLTPERVAGRSACAVPQRDTNGVVSRCA